MVSKDLPESYESWEQRARAVLSDERYRYIATGSGYDETVAANKEAFRRWRLVPRVLKDVSDGNFAVNLCGTQASIPLVLAPVRALGYIHRDGDLGVARAAAGLGIPFVLSTFATAAPEAVSEAMGTSPRWFQLYPGKDKEIMDSLVHRAEVSGYSAIVVTVDKADNYPQYSGPKEHEYDGHGYEVYFSDPKFRSRYGGTPEKHFDEAIKHWKEIRLAPGFSLDDLRHLAEKTKLPIIPKGILSSKDAKLAVENGAGGIVVSNHGGRSLDGEIASLDALIEIRKTVGKGFPIILDSGVRSGADMVKCIALGADAVMVGRAYLFGLAVAGELGVTKVLRRLIKEFDSAMRICGATGNADLDQSMIARI